jgi:hypothetical protein
MDEFCIFKLELSNQNNNPDSPNHVPNTERLYSISELLPLKYERYELEQSIKEPLKIVLSTSPLISSPILYKINKYFDNQHKKLNKKRVRERLRKQIRK